MSGARIRIRDWMETARSKLVETFACSPAGQALETNESNNEVQYTAGLEIQILVGHVFGQSRAWVIAHPETDLTAAQEAQLDDLLAQRMRGVPLPYLLGHWEFFGLDFEVTPDVLIPRPETELLVERALAFLQSQPGCRATDVGTGSGCIAISLLRNNPTLKMTATDISWRALQVVRRNAARHNVLERLALVQADLMAPYTGPFHLVCANLPYIPRKTLETLAVSRFEPGQALNGGEDGLSAIRPLVEDAHRWLAPGGMLLLEMQYDQGDAILKLAREYLPASRANVLLDLAGKPRLVEIEI